MKVWNENGGLEECEVRDLKNFATNKFANDDSVCFRSDTLDGLVQGKIVDHLVRFVRNGSFGIQRLIETASNIRFAFNSTTNKLGSGSTLSRVNLTQKAALLNPTSSSLWELQFILTMV